MRSPTCDYVLTFGTMLVVALLISGFTLRIREQAELARDRERRTAALYALSRDLGDSRALRAKSSAAARHHLEDSFGCDRAGPGARAGWQPVTVAPAG